VRKKRREARGLGERGGGVVTVAGGDGVKGWLGAGGNCVEGDEVGEGGISGERGRRGVGWERRKGGRGRGEGGVGV